MNQNIPLNISPKELNKILKDDSSEKPFIVDVREDDEIAIASFSFSVLHLPLSKAANWSAKIGELLPKDQPIVVCLLYTSPSPRDRTRSRMLSSA